MSQVIYISEATAARRRVFIRLVLASDGISPATSTQVTAAVAQLMTNGADGGNSSAVITQIHATNFPGEWYVELTAGELTTLGVGRHRARFKEADTLESVGGYFDVVPNDVWAAGPTDATIAGAVWDKSRASHVAGGSFGEGVVVNSMAAGSVTATAVATGAIDADAIAADAVAEFADGVWDEARAGHTTAGSFGQGAASVQGNVTGSVASVTGNVGGDVVGSVASVTGNVVGSIGSVANSGIAAGSFATGAIDSGALAASASAEIADGIFDDSDGVETGVTLRQAMRVVLAALAGKSSGGGTVYRNVNDTKDVITATVDGSSNRTAVTLDTT